MFVLLARQANVGVILRRGPTKWWQVTLWDTRLDQFTRGQWFHGHMYPEKCDLSPDGKLFIHFVGDFRAGSTPEGYGKTWTAVSRPPYLTALALWPMIDTWGGNGVFLDNRTVLLTAFGGKHHPNHPPGPLNVLEYDSLRNDDARRDAVPSCRFGWETASRLGRWKKICGDLAIETPRGFRGGRTPSPYMLYRNDGELLSTFEAHWADWDQQGRLVATAGGRVLEGRLMKDRRLSWRQLTAMNEEKPTPMETAKWAQQWHD